MIQTQQYSHGMQSSNHPYNSRYGERPARRSSRDKGRGWQRSLSGFPEVRKSSEVYFSEKRANRTIHPQNNNCGKGRPQSVAKSEISQCVYTRNKPEKIQDIRSTEEPIQRRLLTSVAPFSPKRVPKTDDLNGFVSVASKLPQTTEIRNIEGPKARHYTLKSFADHYPSGFSAQKSDEEAEETMIPHMGRGVQTSSFRERGSRVDEHPNVIESPSWTPYSKFKPTAGENLFPVVNKIRLELKRINVNKDGDITGRMYYDLKRDAILEDITFYVNQVFVCQPSDKPLLQLSGNNDVEIKHLPGRNSKTETAIDTKEKIHNKLQLKSGTSEILFTLHVPETVPPTLCFIDPTAGITALNNYVLSASTRVDGQTVRMDPLQLTVPAHRLKEKNSRLEKGQNFSLIVIDKEDNTFDIGITQTEDQQKFDINTVTAEVVQVVKIRSVDYNTRKTIEKSIKFQKGNSVYEQYKTDHSKANSDENGKRKNIQHEMLKVSDHCPSVQTDNFLCHYEIRAKADDGEVVTMELFVTANDSNKQFEERDSS